MAKVRKLSDIQQEFAFTEFDFYQRYADSFKISEFGRIKSLLLLLLRDMPISFGLIDENPKNIRSKRGWKSLFTAEGRVALAFLQSDILQVLSTEREFTGVVYPFVT